MFQNERVQRSRQFREKLAQLLGKRLWRNGLLEEIVVLLRRTVVYKSARWSSELQHFHPGLGFLQVRCKRQPAHTRQIDVDQSYSNLLVTMGNLFRKLGILRLQHCVTETLQNFSQGCS